MPPDAPVLEVRELRKQFALSRGWFRAPQRIRAVDGVSFRIGRGETLALVGESGCGKSTVANLLMQLTPPTSGEIRIGGEPVAAQGTEALRQVWRQMQMVFQDPYASLNPRMRAHELVAEPLRNFRVGDAASRRRQAAELLDRVGLPRATHTRFAHEFSGGQRQRLGIARALALAPALIVADEPVSALDVSIQAQVVNLFMELQERLGLTYIFIAHDLSVVRHISDRIAVMYLGRITEIATRVQLYKDPLHPYTQALLAAVPIADPELEAARGADIIAGEIPSAMRPPPGCRFHTRCPRAMDVCKTVDPPLKEMDDGRAVACHLHA